MPFTWGEEAQQEVVETDVTHRWPDNLLIAARDGRKITAIVEVDGPDYHLDKAAEKRRDRELGVPVLHLTTDDVSQPDVLDKILIWLDGLFSVD